MLALSILVAAVAAYLLGNLNGAVCISTIFSNEDVRSHGSGNAGLTNYIRNYGAKKALYVVLIDGGKAAIAAINAGLMLMPFGYYQEGLMLGAVAVVLGHICPALLGFRGGKGVLSAFVAALVMDWRVAAVVIAVFALAYFTTHYVSLGSVLGALVSSVCFAVFHRENIWMILGGICICVLVLIMHRGNILRLLKGQERKTDLFKQEKSE